MSNDNPLESQQDVQERRAHLAHDRRVAGHEPVPTGDGEIVLKYVEEKLHLLHVAASMQTALGPLVPPDALARLRMDLISRAEVGKEKYGTYLRTNNGRNVAVDVYLELCDAVMYSAQARMQGDKQAGAALELLINIAAPLGKAIFERENG
jgi:hypothetical protein